MNEQTKRTMIISLIGRPNVGKSSIYNRMMRAAHKTITYNEPGVTRDRHYGITNIDTLANEKPCDVILVDTGGFYPKEMQKDLAKNQSQKENIKNNHANYFFDVMKEQAEMAITESDLVLLVVDVREGIIPFDVSIANYLRQNKKKFWIVVNKYDSHNQAGDEVEFYRLGLKETQLFPLSAAHGLGFETLLENVHQELLDFEKILDKHLQTEINKGVTPREEVISKVALIGAPNTGKSTLLNNLLGANRAVVSDIAGTTVDPIEGYFDLYFGETVNKLKEKKITYSEEGLKKQYDLFRKNNPELFSEILTSEAQEAMLNKDKINETLDKELQALAEASEESLEAIEAKVFDQQSDEDENISESIEEIKPKSREEKLKDGSYWRSVHLVDTAGIRKQKLIKGEIESQSVFRALRCISEADIILYMIDAEKGIGHQDRRLMDIALEKGKSIIICLNKIDLLKEKLAEPNDKKEWLLDIRYKIPWLNYCDVVTISAKYNTGLNVLKNTLKKTIIIRNSVIPTGELNRFVFDIFERHPIVVKKSGGSRLKLKYASMVKTAPPTILLFTNKSKGIPENYKRYLKNNIRSEFRLDNTPVHLVFRTGRELADRPVSKNR